MFVISTISQLEDALRFEVQELLVVGWVASQMTLPRFSGQVKSLVLRLIRSYAAITLGTGGS